MANIVQLFREEIEYLRCLQAGSQQDPGADHGKKVLENLTEALQGIDACIFRGQGDR